MKKILSLIGAVATMFAFTACEDVPAPYEIHSQGGESTTLFSETFTSSLGKFTNFTTEGGVAWANSFSCATATGYDNSTKKTTDGVAYLVGPIIDLTDVDSAYVTYEYILRFNRNQEYQQLMIAENFVPNVATIAEQAWKPLITNHTEGSDYTTFYNASVQIPQGYMGKKVRLALYFKCETNSSTWEVKNFKVIKGIAGQGENNETPAIESTLPYANANLKDGFTVQTIAGAAWSLGNSYAKATGYANNATSATETWLVSPAINTTKAEGNDDAVNVDFDYLIRYSKDASKLKEYHKLMASTDYDGDVTKATWIDLNFDAKESATQTWDFYPATTITLPEELTGKEKVYFAFRFECNSENSTTWELKNLNIHQGTNAGSGEETPITPTGAIVENGDFEAWSSGQPVYWKSASTASSATLTQSTDAHSGKYSVNAEGSSAANKRLAYKEITLKAGEYNMKFYAKAATNTGGSVRPGYVPVTDGKVGSYAYGDYVNNLSASEWTEVNHSFTLSAETTLSFVVMISKSPGANVLIDDFTVTTSNGGVVGGTTGEETSGDNTGSETTDGVYNINFKSSMEGWTINDIEKSGLDYVWTQNTKYGMVASGFANSACNATESTLTSPSISIPTVGANVTIKHALNKLNSASREDFIKVYVLSGNDKEELTLPKWPAGTSWTFEETTASLSRFAGKSIQLQFEYKSNTTTAPSYEIEAVTIK